MKYNFDRIVSREGTCCHKYDLRKEVFGKADVIPMWIADMDFEVAPFITEAITERSKCPLYGYEFRDDRYHQAIIDWVDRRHGWKIQKEWIEFTPGVVAGLVFGVRAFCKEGEGVVIQPPVYPPFALSIQSNGRRVINNPLKVVGDRYEIDFEDLDRKLADARLLMFCNPHNPTGRVFTREELEKVGELCIKHDVYIISDEIHADLVQKPYRHIQISNISAELAERTVTLFAPSKTFNIAGLSTSVAIIPGEKTRKLFIDELCKAHVGGGNTFGRIALEAAFNNGDEWLDQLMEYISDNVSFAKQFVAENLPGVKAYNSGGSFLLWLDFNEWGMSGCKLKEFMINEAGIGMNDGREFGEQGTGFMRMNLGTSREVVTRALNQIKDAYQRCIKK